ncbi:MAG: DUF3429 domain-containing protein [Alphaproteobacteria bacterium]|nr:DUF3429 domain-containing protein [Alphaproteobacteria bacterium]
MFSEIPKPALYLGLGGLIPFAAGTAGVYGLGALEATFALQAQIFYAVTILSFLGAVHWGLAMRDGREFDWNRGIWGVTPALVAWVATWFTAPFALVTLIAGLVGAYLYDVQAINRGLAPEWYRPLRKILSAGAILCLGLTLIRIAEFG